MTTSIEVASNAERACTDYAGAVILTYRYNIYRIEVLTTGAIRSATRNGEPVSPSAFAPAIIKSLAKTAAIYFPPSPPYPTRRAA
jgi:hypothetical protein